MTKHNKYGIVLKKYLVSFILAFIVPSIVIISFFNSYTSNIVKKQAINEHQVYFDDSCKTIERTLNDAINALIQACIDEDTLSLANVREMSAENLMKINTYTKKLLQYSTFNSSILNFVVYYKHNDVVITGKGKYGYYNYFNDFFKENPIDSENFRSILREPSSRQVVPINTIQASKITKRKAFTIIQSFPVNINTPIGSAIVSIDEGILTEMMYTRASDNKDNFII